MSKYFSSVFLRRALPLLLLAGVMFALPVLRAEGDDDNSEDNGGEGGKKGGPAINDKTRAVFIKVKAALEAKDYDGVLNLLESIKPTVKPDSYDMSVILDTEAKILWQGKNTPERAIAPWERLMTLVDAHPDFLEPEDRVNHYQYLAQTYYLVASDTKTKNEAVKRDYLDRSLSYMKRWLAASPRPKQDDLIFYTTLLYYKAVSGGKVDLAALKETKKEIQRGLLSDPRPKEGFYVMLISICQQEGDFASAANYLELLVTKHPSQKDYWLQLISIYNNLAVSNGVNSKQQREYYARAINAAERAQALGFAKTPKDNYNLVSIYDQVGQFGKAIELLYSGMKTGKIESTLKNWQVLAYFHEQIDQVPEAINVLLEAEQNPAFASTGELDRQIADLYYQLDNTQKVYDYCKSAVAKGNNVKNPYTTYQLLAFSAFELHKYDEALAACEKAISYPGSPPDLARLHEGIQDAIKQQAAEKAAAESERRSL